MPIQVILDDAETSQVERFGTSSITVTRGGWAVDLPTDTTLYQPEDVLAAILAAAGMPAMGSTAPNFANSFLTRVQVFGQNSTRARIKLIYEPFQGVGTSLIIDVSSSLGTYASNFMPGTRKPIAVDYSGAIGEVVKPDYPIFNMLRATRRVSVTQLRSGTLDEMEAAAFGDNVEKVNSATWMGKDKGSWLIAEASAQISRYAGYYSRRITAISQGDDKWSYYAIARSNITGKYAADDVTVQAATTGLVALPYLPQSVRPVGANTGGVIRVDPYKMIAFLPLFGF